MPLSAYRDAYLESEVLAADPVELVHILYRTALDSIRDARCHLRAGNIRSRSQAVTKASSILAELALSVDHPSGGVVGRNLVELYDYLQRLLLDANFRQSDPPLAEAERLVATLLEGWAAAHASRNPVSAEYEHLSCTL